MRSVLRAVLVLGRPGGQRREVLEDGVRPLEPFTVARDEEGNLVPALAVLLARRDLLRHEVDAELRQPLPHG
jgi:hypothetical protein